jgi:translation initiation factor 2B subunit (eIF-2B alpha/beta/delta family)
MSDFQTRFRKLLDDRKSGSATLALRLCRLLRAELSKGEDAHIQPDQLPKIIQDAMESFPEMAIFLNFRRVAQAALRKANRESPESLLKALASFESTIKSLRAQTAQHFADNSIELKTLLTLNSSSAVRDAILALAELTSPLVIVCESRPHREGAALASQLQKKGITAECIIDAAAGSIMERIDAVVLGADWIDDDGFINKTGSRMLSDLARLHLKPVYVLADALRDADRTGRARTTSIGPRANPTVIPRDFERVPWNPAHRLVTQDGIRQPVPTHL